VVGVTGGEEITSVGNRNHTKEEGEKKDTPFKSIGAEKRDIFGNSRIEKKYNR